VCADDLGQCSFQVQFHLYPEAFNTATDLDFLALVKVKGEIATRY